MSRPWMKFYPADWRDARLRSCSLAARGLWIDLISYMHEAEPYGHLLIAGKIPTANEIALHLSRPAGEIKRALAELEEFGVCSRSDSGALFSRRMVRDKAKEIQDRENGKGGGNPKLRDGLNGHVNGGVNPQDKAQSLEARVQSPEKKDSKKYVFESGVIRLTEQHFSQWKSAFSYLDLAAELLGLSKWASEQGANWFHAVSGALAKRNREAKERLAERPKFRTLSGMEGIL